MRQPLLILLFVFSVFTYACSDAAKPVAIGNRPISINNVPQPGIPSKPIENMGWTDFDGNNATIKDLKGKAVILDFWATYCAPCIEEIPHLKQLQAKYGKENLVIIGMHVGGEEDKPKVPEFVEKLSIDYTLAEPEKALTSYIFGDQAAIPQTAVFDRNGKLVQKIVGFSDAIKVQLDSAVEKAVNSGS